jgi:ribosomal protein S18 acetylase RimI-like enzyme
MMDEKLQQKYPFIETQLRDARRVILRFLSPEDGEALSDFYLSIMRKHYRFYCPHKLDRRNALSKAANSLNPFNITIVMRDAESEKILGYCWCKWTDANSSICSFGICVRTKCWNLGAGSKLISRLLEIARHEAPPTMILTVQEANPAAIALYEKHGFVIERKQMRKQVEEFLPEPEYFMTLQLKKEI